MLPASEKDPEGWGATDKFTVVFETSSLNAPDQKRGGADRTGKRLLLPSPVSGCWGSPVGIKSIQILRENHAIFPLPVVAHSDGNAVNLVVGVEEREAKATMEGNRVAIDRSCDAASSAAAKRGGRGKEMLVEAAP